MPLETVQQAEIILVALFFIGISPGVFLDKAIYISLFARLALAFGFLSAVADRFGLWTLWPGSESTVWGNMKCFTAYTSVLLPWIPTFLLPTVAWTATLAEIMLGVWLLTGFRKRSAALLSGVLLLTFAFAMLFSLGIKAPFDCSVFTAAACAFLLYKESKPGVSKKPHNYSASGARKK